MSLLHEAEQTETVLVSSATRSLLNGPSFNAGTCFQTQNFRLQALLLLELGSHARRKGDKPVCSSTCLTVEKFCCGVFSEVRSAPLIQFLPLAITPSLPVLLLRLVPPTGRCTASHGCAVRLQGLHHKSRLLLA